MVEGLGEGRVGLGEGIVSLSFSEKLELFVLFLVRLGRTWKGNSVSWMSSFLAAKEQL